MLSTELIIGLGQNIVRLLALVFLYSLIPPFLARFQPGLRGMIQGLFFGFFGVLTIVFTIPLGNGFLLDSKTIAVAIAGAFGGGISALVAVSMVSLYRLLIGGAGSLAAVSSVVVSGLMGFALYTRLNKSPFPEQLRWLFILGVGVAVQGLLWAFLFGQTAGTEAFLQMLVPRLVLIPPGLVLVGLLMLQQIRQTKINLALKESEDRYSSLLNNSPIGLYRTAPDGQFIIHNPAILRILGFSEGETLPQPFSLADFCLDREDWTRWREWLEKYSQVNAFEMQLRRRDAKTVWVKNTARCIQDSEGKTLCFEGVLEDIAEQKHVENELLRERDLLRTLIDTSPDYIFIKDAEGRFLISNTAHDAAAKVRTNELVGKTAFDVFPPDLAARFHADDERIMQSGQPLINVERTTIGKDGEAKTVLTTKIPLRDKQGNVTGLVGVSRDITERKQLEAQTLELNSERERVQVLRRFMTDMSHDFRTPLAIISNSIYLIQKNADPERRAFHANKAIEQIQRMDKLLNELLQMTHLDRPEESFQFVATDISAFLNPLVGVFEKEAAAKQITFHFSPGSDACSALIDRVELERALTNLVENAIAFTPAGGTITLRTTTQADRIHITVQDTGVGIAAKDLSHIFQRFYRADQARPVETGGSGLGLSIAKKIVETHKGIIEVESVPGQGSTFTITLPLHSAN
jgi:PAS domain S-box-containing protein